MKRLFRTPSGENLRTSSRSFPQIQSHRNFLDFFGGTSLQTCLVAQLDRPSVRLGGQRGDSPRTLQFSSPRAGQSAEQQRKGQGKCKEGCISKLQLTPEARDCSLYAQYCAEDQGRRHLASEFDK